MFGWVKLFFRGNRIADVEEEDRNDLLEINLKTGTTMPVTETEGGKLWAKIITNHCPDCGHEGFYEGPSGGMSTNIYCTNEKCGSRFNVTPGIGIAERI